ncbi:MAG: TolC family protein [Labilithrix sp.]|nr:TolC family protein [Labilithrix sp.]
MASLTAAMLGATSLLALTACWSPHETRGATEALAIYRQSARADGPPRFRGPDEGRAAGEVRRAAPLPNAPLTIDSAIRLAKASSARLAEMERRVAVAEASVEAAGQRANPDVRAVNVRLARAIDTGRDPRVAPRIRFTPERPGEIAARQAEARAGADEARALVRAEELAVEAEVRWLFDDVVLLDAEIAAAERIALARRKLAAQTREQLATATATAVDASLADLSAVEAEAHAAERRSRRALVVAALLDRVGLPATAKPVLEGNAGAWPPSPLPSEQTLIEAALKTSARVSGAAARIDGADAHLHLEQTRRWPWFRFVEVGYEFERSNTNVPLWTVGAGVELPIFSANGGAIRQAEASKAAAQRGLEAEVEQIVRDVRARLREANATAALVTEFRRVALPALERASSEAARALDSGGIDTLRALTVEERRCHVEVELFRLVRQYRVAVDALRRAVGGPLLGTVTSSSGGGSRPHGGDPGVAPPGRGAPR